MQFKTAALNGTDEHTCRAGIERESMENGLVDTVGEGEGGAA